MGGAGERGEWEEEEEARWEIGKGHIIERGRGG